MPTSNDNVVPISVQPKTLKRCYRGLNYIVTFIPATRKWRWEVHRTVTLHTYGEADTQRDAIKAAEKLIDEVS